jgi:hypothetical protein
MHHFVDGEPSGEASAVTKKIVTVIAPRGLIRARLRHHSAWLEPGF